MPATARRRIVASTAVALVVMASVMSHYTVEAGDTLSTIARDHGVSASELAAANGIANLDLIYVGQELTIPSGGGGAPNSTSLHVVQPGETLGSIAARYGVGVDDIAAANGIVDVGLIFAGTRLLIDEGGPATQSPPPGAATSGSYVVQPGDTLGGIAARFEVSVSDLVALNGLASADLIIAGQTLTVPGGGLRCPVPGASFFNDWGFPRSGGRYHEGNDLFAARDTPVLAPVSGWVHHYTGDIGGLQFRLDGNDGHRYIGTHLERFGTSGSVSAGEVIGYVGDSGNARGSSPHLHFEIHEDRTTPINPYPLISAACG